MLLESSHIFAYKLLIITAAALIAPIMAHFLKRFRVPSLVLEIFLGILIGPQVLDIIQMNVQIEALSHVGLSFLMFLAGYEIDTKRVKGKALSLACLSWFMSLSLGLLLAFRIVSTGHGLDTFLIGLSLTTMAFGVVLPVLQDAKVLKTGFGAFVLSIGSLGEFGPIMMASLFLTHANPFITLLFLFLFITVTVLATIVATKSHQPKLIEFVRHHLGASSQISVRLAVFMIFSLVCLAANLKLNVLLGAFAAGLVVRVFTSDDNVHIVENKLKAIGYGFLIPLFFIVSGITFDLQALASPEALVRVPFLLLCLLVVRGLPILIVYRNVLEASERRALAFFSGVGLPLIVVIAHVGVRSGHMLPENAAFLVAAGMLSVLIFPVLGLRQLQKGKKAKE